MMGKPVAPVTFTGTRLPPRRAFEQGSKQRGAKREISLFQMPDVRRKEQHESRAEAKT